MVLEGKVRPALRFRFHGREVALDRFSPRATVLDWLREEQGATGTKEGCAEGDCGACTVVLERADGRHEAMNACIAMLGQMDGQSIRTVEGLLGTDGVPHPVQRVFAESDATQCGFCTPGFVMSAYAFASGGEPAETELIHDALAGNLCRCTGYRPIVDAMKKVAGLVTEPASLPPPRTVSPVFDGVSYTGPKNAKSAPAAPAALTSPAECVETPTSAPAGSSRRRSTRERFFRGRLFRSPVLPTAC